MNCCGIFADEGDNLEGSISMDYVLREGVNLDEPGIYDLGVSRLHLSNSTSVFILHKYFF